MNSGFEGGVGGFGFWKTKWFGYTFQKYHRKQDTKFEDNEKPH